MADSVLIPKHIAILAHPGISEASEVAQEVMSFLQTRGVDAQAGLLVDQELRQAVEEQQYDFVIALGGDGTMLRAGHLCACGDVPLLGINVGHFGFLAELSRDDWKEALPDLLAGRFRYEDRMMLHARCLRDGQELASWDVINDVVVTRGQYVRPIRVEATVNGHIMASYVADGLIAATATGSTAYALAAGGPILPPELRNILLMPVAPHLSVDRAVVLSEGVSVCITVHTQHEAVVSVDGQEPVHLHDGDCVQVRSNRRYLRMVRFQDPGYFYRNLTTYMEHNPLISVKRQ